MGSSTLKYSLYDIERASPTTEKNYRRKSGSGSSGLRTTLLCSGLIDRVGENNASHTHNNTIISQDSPLLGHAEGLRSILSVLQDQDGIFPSDIDCVGHRVVHGGTTFDQPTVITPEVRDDIWRLRVLAPLHNPPAVAGIDASFEIFPPKTTQVAVFDTSFHSTMPPSSYRYAVPNEWHEKYNVRKFGFHGSSYSYVASKTADFLKRPLEELNMIIMHLGSGASACCLKGGKSVDTTMGLTPLEGLVMSTRSGDIDPGVFEYLLNNEDVDMDPSEISRVLNKESGMKGLSGTSDMREITYRSTEEGDARSILAREIFAERCRKYLGSYLIKLNGKLDAIVFTGGVGEGDVGMREMICSNLESLNITIDRERNAGKMEEGGVQKIHHPFSKTKVLVVPTNEELGIAVESSKFVLPEEEKSEVIPAFTALKDVSSNLCAHSVGHTYTAKKEVGLLGVFARSVDRIGYFRPIASKNSRRTKLMKETFDLTDSLDDMYGVTMDEWVEMVSQGREDELFEKVLERYISYAKDKDFVLVSTFTEEDDQLHWSAKLCSALSLPVVFLSDAGHDKSLSLAQKAFTEHHRESMGVIVSDIPENKVVEEREKLQKLGLKPVALLPDMPTMNKRTVEEVMDIMDNGQCLFGSQHLQRSVESVRVYTMYVDDLIKEIKENELAVVYHNRSDSLFSLILAAQSANAPRPAGVLLTYRPSDHTNPLIKDMLDGLDDIRIPIISCSNDTIVAAQKIQSAPIFLRSESKRKIEMARDAMETHIDPAFLQKFSSDPSSSLTTKPDIGPRMFQYSMFTKAREAQKSIVLPEGSDPRVVEAASILTQRKLCKVILVGDPEVIHTNAEKVGCSLEGVEIVTPETYDKLPVLVDALVEARKKKGMTPEAAEQLLLQDVNYFGTLMMHVNLADGMVSGARHSSANTIRPALQVIKTAPGYSIVSSVFFMLLEDGVKVFGDCAINVNPSAEELAEIAIASAQTAQQFGIQPRVAMLSYATGDSNKGEMIDKIIKATEIARKHAAEDGDAEQSTTAPLIEGPLQFDAAVDPAVAAVKAKGSSVAGHANVLIFPDLNSGNNGYKAVQQASKTIAVGPILQGLKKPVNDLSRGATVDDIVNTAVITALQSAGLDQ